MAEDSAQERTEAATPRRLEDARKKGQVARSRELNTFASLAGAALGLLVFGGGIMAQLQTMLRSGLDFDYTALPAGGSLGQLLGMAVGDALFALLPLLVLLTALALLSPLALGGFVISADLLLPKFERIDPLKGFLRIFSLRSLSELGKALAKFLLVGAVIAATLALVLDDIAALASLELPAAIARAGSLLVRCFLLFSLALVLVVAFDVPWQLWQQRQQMLMTRQEVREESKDTDGRPEVKSAIRAKQQEIAQRRMMDEMKTADVVITNPTHYAVALRYDQGGGRAPLLVAKGRDLVAARIREFAGTERIAIFSAPPLARALYFSTALNQEIPEKLFVAVAQVLAYVYQLRHAARHFTPPPLPPTQLPVPPELDPQETP